MDFSFTFKSKPSESAGKVSQSAAATQFAALRDAGIEAAQGVTAEHLAKGQPKGAFDDPPFVRMLSLLGATKPDGQPWSDDVWLLPPPGESGPDFADILANLARISKRCLEVGAVDAVTDEERSVIVVSVELNATPLSLEVPTYDSPNALFPQLAPFAAQFGEGSRFAFVDIDAGRLFVWRDDAGLEAVTGATGLAWAWVE